MAACDDLATLNAAIALGAKVVEYADKRVEYRSLDDMFRVKADLERQCNGAASRQNGRKYGEYHSGL